MDETCRRVRVKVGNIKAKINLYLRHFGEDCVKVT